jgi:hypothetical protein
VLAILFVAVLEVPDRDVIAAIPTAPATITFFTVLAASAGVDVLW